ERVGIDAHLAADDEPGVEPGDPHAPSAQIEHRSLVAQQRRRLELGEIRGARLRVARDREVVVAENGVHRLRQPLHERAQQRLSARMREQVAGEDDEIGPPYGDPLDGGLDRVRAARRNAEVEVGEMRDAEPVELRRQTRQLDLELAQAHPAGLEPPPGESAPEYGSGAAPEGCHAGTRPSVTQQMPPRPRTLRRAQTSNRSKAGLGSTMCRLNFSSDSSIPAATPTSWARWRIGRLKLRPVAFS